MCYIVTNVKKKTNGLFKPHVYSYDLLSPANNVYEAGIVSRMCVQFTFMTYLV